MTGSRRASARLVARATALGLATGGRSTAGLAVLASSTAPDSAHPPPLAWLSRPRGTRAVQLMSAGELVADKVPGAPSRLFLPSLVFRTAAGAAAAGALAQRSGAPAAGPAVAGAAAALAASWAGARWRAYADDRGLPGLAAAVAEDLVVLSLAVGAVRQPR